MVPCSPAAQSTLALGLQADRRLAPFHLGPFAITMNARTLLVALAAVVAAVGLVLHWLARNRQCPASRQVDRIAGHLLWAVAILITALGVLGPSPEFDRVSGNAPGAVVLLSLSTVVVVGGVVLLRASVLWKARGKDSHSAAAADKTLIRG
jgi:hypothetical protein